MKTLYLMVYDLKVLFCNRKKLFVMLAINLLISFVALIYFCSFYYSDYEHDENINQLHSPYIINFNESGSVDHDKFEQVITNVIEGKDLPKIFKISLHGYEFNQHIIGFSMSEQDYRKFFIVDKGIFLNTTNMKEAENIAFVSQSPFNSQYEKYSIRDTISVNNKRYTIIGIGSSESDDALYIPYKNFLKSGYSCTQIQINFEKKLSRFDLKWIDKQLSVLDNYDGISTASRSNTNTEEFIFQMFIALGIIAISITGIINIFRCLITLNLSKLIIYILCGMNPTKRFLMILLEITIVISCIYAIAIMAIALLYGSLNIGLLSIWQYFGLFITVLLIVITTVTISARKIFNNTIIERI